jgi:hypothetical protein
VVARGDNTNNQCEVGSWTDIVQVAGGGWHTVGLQSDGTVVAVGENSFGQCDVGSWTDIVQVAAGSWHTVGLQSDGTVVAVGENGVGQCDVHWWDLGMPEDSDNDGVPDTLDNDPLIPNGPEEGTCVKDIGVVVVSYKAGEPEEFITCTINDDCTATNGYCEQDQGDWNGNGTSDVSECYADFDGNNDVDPADLLILKSCFGKTFAAPGCGEVDINNDGIISTWDLLIFMNQSGRSGCPPLP